MTIRLKGNHITDHQIEILVKEEVMKIKDIMPSTVRNVQVRIGDEVPAGMFEHIDETVHLGLMDIKTHKTPVERLRFILWHEYRHALQYRNGILKMKKSEVIWGNMKPVPVIDVLKKLHFDGDGYNTLPWELDANASAADNVPEYNDPHPLEVYKRKNIELKVLF